MCFTWACQSDEEEVDYSVQELEVETARNYTKGEQILYELNTFAELLWQHKDADSLNTCDYTSLTAGTVVCEGDQVKIYYGSNGIIEKDGVFRKNTLVFTFDKKYKEDSASCKINIYGYGKDTLLLDEYNEMKSTLTFLSADSVHYLLENGALSFGDGTKCEWSVDKIRVAQSDGYYFYGTATGKNILGNEYSLTIQEPEVILPLCSFSENLPVQGIVNIDFTSDSLVSRVIDYGNGECNQNATIKIGKLLYDFILE